MTKKTLPPLPRNYRHERRAALQALSMMFRADVNLSAAEAARRLITCPHSLRTRTQYAELVRSLLVESVASPGGQRPTAKEKSQ